jgi:dihydroxyacetone kinase-like protein
MARATAQPIGGPEIAAAIERVAARLVELRDELNRLDAAVGDGDLGITMSKGASALREYVATQPPGDDLGKFLFAMGRALNNAAPSTMGTLMATALMRAGKEARGHAALDDELLAGILIAADEGIQERGKAQMGDKTIVDALHPAAAAFATTIEGGGGRDAAAAEMLRAARAGRDAAIPLRSKIGRASWVGERTEGQPDPGTVLFVQILETILGADHTAPGSETSG